MLQGLVMNVNSFNYYKQGRISFLFLWASSPSDCCICENKQQWPVQVKKSRHVNTITKLLLCPMW